MGSSFTYPSDVELPESEQVRGFLPPYKKIRIRSIHRHTVSQGPQIMPRSRSPPLQLGNALAPWARSRWRFEEVHDQFANIFGRRYDPWVEKFMTDDAEVVFLCRADTR